LIELLV